jgi:hypothetical protein
MLTTASQNRVNSARRTVPTLVQVAGELVWLPASRVVEVEGDVQAAANLLDNVRSGRLPSFTAGLWAAQQSLTFEAEWLRLTG